MAFKSSQNAWMLKKKKKKSISTRRKAYLAREHFCLLAQMWSYGCNVQKIYFQSHFNVDQFKSYRKKLNRIIRGAKRRYYNVELFKHKHNMTFLWWTSNRILNKNNKYKQLPNKFKVDGGLITDLQLIANDFNSFFSDVGPTWPTRFHPPIIGLFSLW